MIRRLSLLLVLLFLSARSALAQHPGSGSGGGQGGGEPRVRLQDPERAALIESFGVGSWYEQEWLVRLTGAGIALALALVGSFILGRLIAIGRSKWRVFQEFEQLITRLVRWVYWPLALVFVLEQAGIYLGGLWSFLAGALALVALGLIAVWSILSNTTSALVILSSRFFKVGDHMEVTDGEMGGGLRGICRDVGLVFTTLEMDAPNGKGSVLARIPNNIMFQKNVLVYRHGALPEKSDADAQPSEDEDDDGAAAHEAPKDKNPQP